MFGIKSYAISLEGTTLPIGSGILSRDQASKSVFKNLETETNQNERSFTYSFYLLDEKENTEAVQDLKASFKTGFGLGKIKADLNLNKLSQSDSNNITLLIEIKSIVGGKTLRNRSENNIYNEIIEKASLKRDEFDKTFGYGYIAGETYGADLIATVAIKTKSESERNDIKGSISGKYLTTSAAADFKKELDIITSGKEISINIQQKGGKFLPIPTQDISKLIELAQNFHIDAEKEFKETSKGYIVKQEAYTWQGFFGQSKRDSKPEEADEKLLERLYMDKLLLNKMRKNVVFIDEHQDQFNVVTSFERLDLDRRLHTLELELSKKFDKCNSNPEECFETIPIEEIERFETEIKKVSLPERLKSQKILIPLQYSHQNAPQILPTEVPSKELAAKNAEKYRKTNYCWLDTRITLNKGQSVDIYSDSNQAYSIAVGYDNDGRKAKVNVNGLPVFPAEFPFNEIFNPNSPHLYEPMVTNAIFGAIVAKVVFEDGSNDFVTYGMDRDYKLHIPALPKNGKLYLTVNDAIGGFHDNENKNVDAYIVFK
jgi:hypothetical protein